MTQYREIIIDCRDSHLIDHTVMARLKEFQHDLGLEQRSLSIIGLDTMRSLSHHPLAVLKHSTAVAA